MVLWHNVLDVATLNAYTNFTAQHPDYMGGVTNAQRLFIKELGKELVMPHKRRMEARPTPKSILHYMWDTNTTWQKVTGRKKEPG